MTHISNIDDIMNLPVQGVGLLEGTLGKCLCLFEYSRYTKCTRSGKLAESLFNDVIGKIDYLDNFDFSDGLLGVGWVIEYLAQRKFVVVDTNSFLYDLDDELYKLTMYSELPNLDVNTGTLGRMLYYYRRISAETVSYDFFRDVCNRECLILLSDDLIKKVNKFGCDYQSLSYQDVFLVSQALVMLGMIQEHRLNFDPVERTLSMVTENIDKLFMNWNYEESQFERYYVFLLNAWRVTGVRLHNLRDVNKCDTLIQRYKYQLGLSTSFPLFISEYMRNNDSTNANETEQISVKKILIDIHLKYSGTSFLEPWLIV